MTIFYYLYQVEIDAHSRHTQSAKRLCSLNGRTSFARTIVTSLIKKGKFEVKYEKNNIYFKFSFTTSFM